MEHRNNKFMKEKPKNWYAIRCLLSHPERIRDTEKNLFEERVTLWNTDSEREAYELAEEEAQQYAKEDYKNMIFIKAVDSFHLFDEELYSGVEVWRVMKCSNLDAETYINTFMDTKRDRKGIFNPNESNTIKINDELMKEQPENWYAIRCLFSHLVKVTDIDKNLFEERVTLWNTETLKEAHELAEKEARQYAEEDHKKMIFVEVVDSFHLFDEELYSGVEVWGGMRGTNLDEKTYIHTFMSINK